MKQPEFSNGLLTRREIEERESQWLSPHACLSGESLGRVHEEEEHPYRSAFQRDRDRLIHSTAFRRLEYKTQVFINHEGDYYRTRLTHTMEVVQIARSIARSLRLNEDLAEAMALAHDLGHTPFGHSVESVLDELLSDQDGFEHNAQGLRCVDLLETPYPDFTGLNLTYEVRSIFTKKFSLRELCQKGFASPGSERFIGGPRQIILEAQIVDLADGIAYNSHDVDDGIKAGLLDPQRLCEVEIWNEVWLDTSAQDMSIHRHSAIRELINQQIIDVVQESSRAMQQMSTSEPFRSQTDFPALKDLPGIIKFSPRMKQMNQELKTYLRENLYQHPLVMRKMDRARQMIRRLFDTYLRHPEQMAPQFHARIQTEPLSRVVCDYIAGMTDRFAQDEYISLHLPENYPLLP